MRRGDASAGTSVPSGVTKSSEGSSFHVPRSPLVLFLKLSGASNAMANVPSTSVNVKAMFEGNKAVMDPLESRTSVMFPSGMLVPVVVIVEMLNGFPAISTSRSPAAKKSRHE